MKVTKTVKDYIKSNLRIIAERNRDERCKEINRKREEYDRIVTPLNADITKEVREMVLNNEEVKKVISEYNIDKNDIMFRCTLPSSYSAIPTDGPFDTYGSMESWVEKETNEICIKLELDGTSDLETIEKLINELKEA